MGKIITNRLFCLVVGTASASCGSADYRTIVGAAAIYSVSNMVSDISLTTNDIAVGFGSYTTDPNKLDSSIYYI
jgi:hypothetical protein